MIGLVYLLFFVLYLLISAYVIYRATLYARRKYNKGWVGGWLMAFLMYNLVFWDWIPVVVAHKYYCEKDAGFWVYKTPEQWIKENSKDIGNESGSKFRKPSESVSTNIHRYWFSERIYMDVEHYEIFFGEIGRSERALVDGKTGDTLARAIEFSRGSSGLGQNSLVYYKFWLRFGNPNCGPDGTTQGFMDFLGNYRYTLEKLAKGDR